MVQTGLLCLFGYMCFSSICQGNIGDDGVVYTNDFTFILRNIKFLEAVKNEARSEGFTYGGKIVSTHYLFRKEDMELILHKNPRYLETLAHKLSNFVLSIERDYERPVYWNYLTTDNESGHYANDITTPGQSTQETLQVNDIGEDEPNRIDETGIFKHIVSNSDDDDDDDDDIQNMYGSMDDDISENDDGDIDTVEVSSSAGKTDGNMKITSSKPMGKADLERPIRVGVVDVGFQMQHPNLVQSVNRELSRDFVDDDTIPDPGGHQWYGQDTSNFIYKLLSHGTNCMGRIAAKRENGCDPGVASNIQLVALRTLRCKIRIHKGLLCSINDVKESKALSYLLDDIDVLSCSYGSTDNYGFSGPGTNAEIALQTGVEQGRNCRGRIFVYPSGNGHHDNCNADGYSNSIYTITIANVDRQRRLPKYKEICPCALAAAFGDGFITTFLEDKCSDGFGGSSAAAAVAAGYIGEILRINPLLSKRDIEHIIVTTASHNNLFKTTRRNGAGLLFHEQTGFGIIDLEHMKEKASTWQHVPEKKTCKIPGNDNHNEITNGNTFNITKYMDTNSCVNTSQQVLYTEHVQLEMNLNCSNLNEVKIQLISPCGTVSPMLTKIRIRGGNGEVSEVQKWKFMSVQFWRENPLGVWKIVLSVNNASSDVICKMDIENLILHGTTHYPLDNPTYSGIPLTCKSKPEVITRSDSPEPSTNVDVYIAVVAAVLFCVIIVLSFVYCLKRRKTANENSTKKDSEKRNGYSKLTTVI